MSYAALSRSCREQRADRVLADVVTRLQGQVLPLDASEMLVLARDGGVLVLDRLVADPALEAMGLGDLLTEVDAARRPGVVPCVIVVDDHACVAWLDVSPLAMGGDA
ncbi:MAG: hypothetical protein NVS3B10_30420 [Polyangiales bacterium]